MKYLHIYTDGPACHSECFAYACNGYCPIYETYLDKIGNHPSDLRNKELMRKHANKFKRCRECREEKRKIFQARITKEEKE